MTSSRFESQRPDQRSPWYALSLIISFSLCLSVSPKESSAKVRASDLLHPTDHQNLGRGYAPPSPRFSIDAMGTIGGTSDPFKSRTLAGVVGALRSPFSGNELGVRWAIFSHSLTTDLLSDQSVYTSNVAVDWRWLWGQSKSLPYLSVGISFPMSQLQGEGSEEGEIERDARQVTLAGAFGGLDRWMWEPNSASGFFQLGWRGQWNRFALEGEASGAYLYRVVHSTTIDPVNLFAQAKMFMGLKGKVWRTMVGGGYALTPTSTELDVDQISAHVQVGYKGASIDYLFQGVVNIDPPLGISLGESVWVALFGISGET